MLKLVLIGAAAVLAGGSSAADAGADDGGLTWELLPDPCADASAPTSDAAPAEIQSWWHRRQECDRAISGAKDAAADAPLVAELNALGGFKAARWGMSPAQVKGLFPKASRSENKMQLRMPVAGFPSTVTFFFAQEKLKAVLVAFQSTDKVASNGELLQSLAKALREKYGRGTALPVALGQAVGWAGKSTEITLRDSSAAANLTSDAEIEYDSVELRNVVPEVSKKAKHDL